MSMSKLKIVSGLLIAISVVFAFQNCSDQYDSSLYNNTQEEDQSSSGDESADEEETEQSGDAGGSPIGVLEEVSSTGLVSGWACDLLAPNATVTVRLKAGTSSAGAAVLSEVLADQPSSSTINTSCQGGTAHKFTYQLTSSQLANYAGQNLFAEALSYPNGQIKIYIVNGLSFFQVPRPSAPPPPPPTNQGIWTSTGSTTSVNGSCTANNPPSGSCIVGTKYSFIPYCARQPDNVYTVTTVHFVCVAR